MISVDDEEKTVKENEPLQDSEQEIGHDSKQHTTQPTIPSKKSSYNLKHVWLGIGMLALLHPIIFLFEGWIFAIGILQVVYLIPATLIFKKYPGIVQGLIIGGGITFLLNAACFGLVISGVLY